MDIYKLKAKQPFCLNGHRTGCVRNSSGAILRNSDSSYSFRAMVGNYLRICHR